VVNTMQGGFGASMHAIEDSLPVSTDNGKYRSWGGSVWGGNPPAGDSLRWKAIYQHADWLGLDWCRVEVDHGMYEPKMGEFSFDNHEMNILYRWLEYCQSRDVDVYFTEMWPDAAWLVHENFLGDGVAELRSAPNNFQAWANGYATMLEYLIKNRGFDCIKWISVNNEPMEEWSWWKAADGSPQDILPGLDAMYTGILKRNLSVQLVATDGPFKYEFGDFEKYLPLTGAIAFHDYASVFDWWGSLPNISHTEDMTAQWKAYGRQHGNRPLFMAEFGSFLYGIEKDTDGPSRWLSLLHDVQLVMRLSNAGIDGMNRWSFVNRGDLDGQWQLIETWDQVKRRLTDSIVPQPNAYYLYGLITRFTAKNSDVLLTTVEGETDTAIYARMDGSMAEMKHVYASTFRSPANKNISLFITNDSEEAKALQVDLSRIPGRKFYFYELNRLAEGKDKLFLAPERSYSSGKISLNLSPLSLVVFSTYQLEDHQNGIIED
jgi:hypothetical protein